MPPPLPPSRAAHPKQPAQEKGATTSYTASTYWKFKSKWGGPPPLLPSQVRIGSAGQHCVEREITMTPIRIGLDIAKNVFQAHGVDANGTVVIRKRLRRPEILRFFASLPPCLIGIEACSASHHWARELIRLGHDVRLMPGRYVKPYVHRGKSDALDAEGVWEAG